MRFHLSSFQFPVSSFRFVLGAAFGLGILLGTVGCDHMRQTRLAGRTMGTTYHVTVVHGWLDRPRGLETRVAQRLETVNQRFSTYLTDSEINRFNRWPAGGQPFRASAEFYHLLETAARIYHLSGGAWDGTVRPLVDLWGFGPAPVRGTVPAAEEIAALKNAVGFANITLGPELTIAKSRDDIALDLASIAKGYGVDAVAELIRSHGYRDFLVEIGGEVAASGNRPGGGPWKVGINTPSADAPAAAVYGIVSLSEGAMATSGDYRNFFERDGRRYAHIIDPRTGYPVANGVISATVLAPDCTLADGLATALCVMGPAPGLALVETLPGVEALILTTREGGGIREHRSGGFDFTVPR
ncbi:MAG TPA: FAD:protein FMN transferase [Desulfobacteraceae bacterium]|nr:FAD:protein FMN transferase [Deltaproteobacteria bacterium]HDI59506.1 FAD:protein FMN transferase [Desulfobacteraceae bacterium]